MHAPSFAERDREVREVMDFGAHLPLMDFGSHPYTLEHLVSYTEMAARLGFQRAGGERSHGLPGCVA